MDAAQLAGCAPEGVTVKHPLVTAVPASAQRQAASHWTQPPQRAWGGAGLGRSNSASSTFSSEPCVDLGGSEGSPGLITLQQLQALQAGGSAGLVPGYVLGLAAVPAMLPAHLAGIQQQQQQQYSRGLAAALDRQLSGSQGGYGGGGGGSEQHSAGALSGREGSGGHLLTDDGLQCGAATSTASPAHSSQTPPYVDCGDDTEGTGGGSEGGGGAHKVVLPAVNLRVTCGDLVGVLMVDKAKVVMHGGTPQQKEMSPTEFERLGGRSATKKWKQSIRLISDDGEPGRPVGEWYVQMGLEPPKRPREKESYNAGSPAAVYLDRHDRHNRHVVAAATAAVAAEAAAATASSSKNRGGRPTNAAVAAMRAARKMQGADAAGGSGGSEAFAGSGLGAAAGFPLAAALGGGWGVSGLAAAASAAASLQFGGAGNPLSLAPAGSMPMDDPAVLSSAAFWQQQQQQQQQHQQQQLHQQQQQWSLQQQATISAAAAAAAYAAAASGDYAVVPAARGQPELPGDSSLAVIEMGAYLQGVRSTPPWRLLPINQRPLVGRQLVPLRSLFIMMLHLGGYLRVREDERLWQEIAMQLEVPAWPSPEVPEPIKVLQQVYRDYLLRFEAKFVLVPAAAAAAQGAPQATGPPQPVAAALLLQQMQGKLQAGAAAGGGAGAETCQDHSPALSSATTQCNADGQRTGMSASGSATDVNALVLGGRPMAQQQQPQQGQAGVLGRDQMQLDKTLSSNLMDLLTDLIPPDDDTGAEAAAAPGAGGAAPSRAGSLTLAQIMAAQELANRHALAAAASAAGGADAAALSDAAAPAAAGGVARQHPEMAIVQRRRQQLQLLAQLQRMKADVASGGFGAHGSGSGGSGVSSSTAAHGSAGASGGGGVPAAAGGLKRPAPLVRCGDSDLVTLMDQADVAKALQEHDAQQHAARVSAQQQLTASAAARATTGGGAARGSHAAAAAAAAAPAVGTASDEDADMDPDMLLMCEMLQGYLQPEQSQQQRGGPSEQQPLQARAAEEEVSGLLQALQIEGLPAQAMAQPDLLPQLGVQKSVGAHLLADLLSQQQQQQQGAAAGVQRAPSAACAALASAAAASQQQQQRGKDEPSLPGFSGGLLRLTTPNSAIIGAALDSPAGARPGSGQWWAELPTAGTSPPAGGAQGREQQQQLPAASARPGGQCSNAAAEEDLSALMTMWGSGDA